MLWNNQCEKCSGIFLSGDEPPKYCPFCKENEKEDRDDESAKRRVKRRAQPGLPPDER